MSTAKHYMGLLDSLDYEEDGRYAWPYYEDLVGRMRRDAAEWNKEDVTGGLDSNEHFAFQDGSKCVLHNTDQAAFRAYIEITA